MAGSLKSFEDLECWKAATQVRRYVIGLVKKFPDKEKFALSDDMTRAARSATHNIAEGFGRYHYQENVQFCRQTRGSLDELLDQLITALDEKYITEDEYKSGKELVEKSLALLNGYINYLLRAKRGTSND
jgi:four helix bundle protein